MQQLVLIAAGGSLGAIARYGLSMFVYQGTSETFPWGTLAVNLAGCFLIGSVVELFDHALDILDLLGSEVQFSFLSCLFQHEKSIVS